AGKDGVLIKEVEQRNIVSEADIGFKKGVDVADVSPVTRVLVAMNTTVADGFRQQLLTEVHTVTFGQYLPEHFFIEHIDTHRGEINPAIRFHLITYLRHPIRQ